MSNPSFSNIDLWLFELAEGNLSPEQIEQLEAFLMRHPELELDRDVWEMTKLESKEAHFPNQNELKRKPIGWYVAGAASIILLSVAGYYYSGSDIRSDVLVSDKNSSELIEKTTSHQIHNDRSEVQPERDIDVARVNSQGERNSANDSKTEHAQVFSNEQLQIFPNRTEELQVDVLENNVAKEEIQLDRTNQNGNIVGLISANAINSEYDAMERAIVEEYTNKEELGDNGAPHINTNPVRAQLDLDELQPRKLKEIDYYSDNELEVKQPEKSKSWDSYVFDYPQYTPEAEQNVRPNYFSVDNYRLSFKQKLNRFSREMRRMMDNPIALTNYRDPYYHVPGMLPNDVNFSATGTMLSTRVQAVSRLQWFGEKNEQLLSQIAIDGYVYGMRGGIGLQINHAMYNDGGLNIASAAITYSPKISVSRTISIEPSLRFKMGNKSLDNFKMDNVDRVELDRGNPHDFYADGIGPTGNNLWFKDLGIGMMVNTEWFFAGAQLDNLFRHKDNIYTHDAENPRRADYHFVGTIGTDWVSKKEDMSISNYLVYQGMENLSELWLGANLRYKWFTFGGAVSSNFDAAASIGLKFDHFALTYNTDYTKSEMLGERALSHQLTLRFVAKPSRFGRQLLNL